jgi:FkbM family methyltransferase
MLIDLAYVKAKYALDIKGIIHVGAHIGQEFEKYMNCLVKNVAFFEPCTPAFEILQSKFLINRAELGFPEVDVQLFKVALGSYQGEALMNVENANEGQSNSLLRPKAHLQHYPSIQFPEKELVQIAELQYFTDLDFTKYNMLNMDVQGYELEVLKGSKNILPLIDYVYTEVNTQELYEGNAMLDQMDAFLSDFDRVELSMTDAGWGDALYIRKKPAITEAVLPQEKELPSTPATEEDSDMVSLNMAQFMNGMIAQDENTLYFGQGVSVTLDKTRYVMLATQMHAKLAKSIAAFQKVDEKFWKRVDGLTEIAASIRSLMLDVMDRDDALHNQLYDLLEKFDSLFEMSLDEKE